VAAPGVERGGQQLEVLAGVHVERERRHGLDRAGHAGVARGGHVARAAARPEGRLDRVRWCEQQRVGPLAVAVRHDDRGGPVVERAAQQAGQLAGVDQGRVPRHEQNAVEAVALGVADPDHRRRRLARHLGVAQHLHPLAERRGLGHRVGGHHSHRVDSGRPPQRRQHVREHRLCERLARPSAERRGQALLRRAETLDGEDRDRAHREGRKVGRE
jgi:hypothetical protein